MNNVNEKQIGADAAKYSLAGRREAPRSIRPNLRVTVLATHKQATLVALSSAGKMAANLGARIVLMKTQTVHYRLPIDHPPVSPGFLLRQLYGVVCEAGIEAEEILIQLWLCRDANESLRKILSPHSLVVIGGRRNWWSRRDKNLELFLRSLGHEVVFVNLDAQDNRGPASWIASLARLFQTKWTLPTQREV